jgi:isoamylase
LRDDDFLILFSAHHEALEFRLPPTSDGTKWFPLLDTSREDGVPEHRAVEPGTLYPLKSRSLVLLLHVIARI